MAARSFLIWGEEFSRKRLYEAAEKLYQRAWGWSRELWGTNIR